MARSPFGSMESPGTLLGVPEKQSVVIERWKVILTLVAFVTSWCPDCMRAKRILKEFGHAYEEIDIEKVPGAEELMRSLNGGSGKIPTIVIQSESGKQVLIEPENMELRTALRNHLIEV